MRQGTPGFVGERLREAREARGIPAASLASQLGVSRQAISQYEKGAVSPHPEVMRQIATALELPLLYFCQPPRPPIDAPLHFRSLARASVSARKRAANRFAWLLDIAEWISEYVEFPMPSFPEFDLPTDPSAISSTRVEQVAESSRTFWGLGDGPIGNVVRLLERNGAIVARGAASEDIDAFSTWVEGTPYVFLGSEKTSAARSRFNAAHELGHLILHKHVDVSTASNPEIHGAMEEQANHFASAFLLPSKSFACDLRGSSMPYFQALKPKWVVSIGAMIYRAKDLGLVGQDQVTRLWKQRARLGWNTHEPWDDEIPIEEPCLLRKSIELILADNVVAPEDILTELPLATYDIEELAGLPKSYLSIQGTQFLSGTPSGNTRAFSRRLRRVK